MRDEGHAAGIIVTAFLLGAVTGAAVALLLAPASGDETRRKIADRAREGKYRATDAARQGREFINRQRETIDHAVERGRQAYQQARGGTTAGPADAAPGVPSPAKGPGETL
jgi:gas vesicle protein